MAVPMYLVDAKTLKAIETRDYGQFGTLIVTGDPLRLEGVFKTTKILASGGATQTIRVASPPGDGSIILSDLIVSFEKKTSSEITLQFNDGTNTELVWFGDLQDAPIFFGIPFQGSWQGWQSAYLEIVVAGAGADGSIAVGYTKVLKENSLCYVDWNARR